MKKSCQPIPTRRVLVHAIRLGVGISSSFAPVISHANCNPFASPYSLATTYATSSDCNIASGNTFTIESVAGSLTNTSPNTLTNAGSLTNNEYLENSTGASLTNSGNLTNNNYLVNSGTLDNQATGVLQNNGSVYNTTSANLNNSGSLLNTDNTIFWNYGSLTNQTGGNLENSGEIQNTYNGTLTNEVGATLTNAGGLISTHDATFSNAGLINNTGRLNVSNGNMTNSGTLNSSDGGSLYLTDNASLTNTGSINNSSNFAGTLVENSTFNGTGSVNLTDSGWFEVTHYNGTSSATIAHTDNLVAGTLSGNWYVGGYGTGSASLTLGDGSPITEIAANGFVEIWGQGAQFGQLLNPYSMNLNTLNGGLSLVVWDGGNFANQSGHELTIGATGSLVSTGTGAFYNEGTINVAGTIQNQNSSAFENSGEINITGGLHNHLLSQFSNTATGQLNIQSGGLLHNDGSSQVAIEGSVTNHLGGTIENEGAFFVRPDGHLINEGAIGNTGGFIVESLAQVTGTGSYIQFEGETIVDGSFTQRNMSILSGDLRGNGTITLDDGLTIETGATLTPGSLLTLDGDLNLKGTLVENINGPASGEYGMLNIIGAMSFVTGSSIHFNLAGFTLVGNQYWDFLHSDQFIDLTNSTFQVSGIDPTLSYQISEYGITGGGYTVRFSLVPEPGSLALLVLGGVMLRKKRLCKQPN